MIATMKRDSPARQLIKGFVADMARVRRNGVDIAWKKEIIRKYTFDEPQVPELVENRRQRLSDLNLARGSQAYREALHIFNRMNVEVCGSEFLEFSLLASKKE